MKLEICVGTIEEAIAASQAGADRIEFCENLSEGGTTPSYGSIQQAALQCNADVYAMIRPRGGDFNYSATEFNAMLTDVEACKKAGAKGVVFGVLTPEFNIDANRCKELVQLAKSMNMGTTFHRAFDMVTNPLEQLKVLRNMGVNRILTSGQEPTAQEGIALINELIQLSCGEISIMPGSGINAHNAKLFQKMGAPELHFSCRKIYPAKKAFSFGEQWQFDQNKFNSIKSGI